MRPVGRRERRALVAVVILGLALRLGVALLGSGDERFTNVDTESYRAFAAALPEALGDPSDPTTRAVAYQRSPGYPVVVRALGGASGSYGILVVAQCLVGGAVTVLLVHRLGREVAEPAVGLVAAAVVAVDPVSIGHCLLVGTETLFTALVAAGALGAWRVRTAVRAGRSGLAAATVVGVMAGVGALVRPQATYLVPLVALGIGCLGGVRRVPGGAQVWRPRLVAAGVTLVVATVIAVPWAIRTSVIAGRPLLSTAQGQNLADFGAAAMEADRSGVAWWPEPTEDSYARQDRARAGFEARYRTADGHQDPARLAARWEAAGWDALAAHPRGAVAVAGSSLVRGLVGPGDTLILQAAGPDPPTWAGRLLRPPSVAVLALELALVALGIVVLVRRRDLAVLGLLVLPTVVYLVTSAGPQLYARFRVPIVPFLAVLAALGAVAVIGRIAPDRLGRS